VKHKFTGWVGLMSAIEALTTGILMLRQASAAAHAIRICTATRLSGLHGRAVHIRRLSVRSLCSE
jgi:hypothetical protein